MYSEDHYNPGKVLQRDGGLRHLCIVSRRRCECWQLRRARSQSMSQVTAWFERKFEFTFPAEQFPNLCIRLRGTPARLEEIARQGSREIFVRKMADKWSAQEHAGHLADLEPLWLARVDDFLTDGKTLTIADLSNRKTDEANHNARELKHIAADFRAGRSRLLDRVDRLPPDAFARTLLHPRLQQPMRLIDHLFFVAEHDDHHLARIWEMVSIS
jgi:uncharacterized damage-inducible protein DinB